MHMYLYIVPEQPVEAKPFYLKPKLHDFKNNLISQKNY